MVLNSFDGQQIAPPSSSSSPLIEMKKKLFKSDNLLSMNNNNDVQRRVNNHHHHHNNHHYNSKSQLRLDDSQVVFDPTIEEFSLHNTRHKQQQQQFDNDKMDKNQPNFQPDNDDNDPIMIDSTMDDQQQQPSLNDNAEEEKEEEEEESVKKIIDSGWIQHSSTKKLLYYLGKIDKVLFNNVVGNNLDKFDELDDSFMNPNEDELMINQPNQQQQQQNRNKSKTLNSEMENNNKNFEIILNRMMNTPTVVKKRGEGPQLSIDYPLTVLRQRLVAELARRKAKKTEEQIAINTEILKKLGRRRRRRSIQQTTSDQSKRQNLNSIKHFSNGKLQQHFRNNDKYYNYDRINSMIINNNKRQQMRINSKKQSWPIINRLNAKIIAFT
ncbi:hypothetical protein DERP_011676, partial [Dermatophagoides pteronyssinus]